MTSKAGTPRARVNEFLLIRVKRNHWKGGTLSPYAQAYALRANMPTQTLLCHVNEVCASPWADCRIIMKYNSF